jgi:outer membrane protein
LNRQNIRALQDEFDATKTQHGAGAVTRTDVDQAQARLSRAQSDLATAQKQYETSREAFENVIGRPAPTLEPDPKLPLLPANLENARSVGAVHSPPDRPGAVRLARRRLRGG